MDNLKEDKVYEEKSAARPLIVIYDRAEHQKKAESLAEHLETSAVQDDKAFYDTFDDHMMNNNMTMKEAEHASLLMPLMLRIDDSGLSLTDGKLSLQADLSAMLPRLKKNNLEREFLVKAARIKGISASENRLIAVDATAGLGDDSLLLAASGYTVELYEYDPVIAALLDDALHRAAGSGDDILCDAVSRMHLHEGDSISAMKKMAEMSEQPDIILLDPMFPERQKSALVKKKFQLLQQLESPCAGADENELLEAAEAAGPRRIIIKRPLKGVYLAGRRPEYSIAGKSVRYDCIVIPRQ